MKRLVAIFIILVLTCFLFAGCDIVDSAIDGVDFSKNDIRDVISNLIHTHSYEQTVTEPVYGVDGYTTYTCACGDSYKADFTKYYSHGFGLKFNDDKTGYILMRIGYCDDKDIVIPPTYEGVPIIAIGNGAFRTEKITSVTIPDSVTSISPYAFYYCENLKSVTIGNGVTRIDNLAFAYCANLQNVTIGKNVSYIGYAAFGACDSLTSVTIPDSVTFIDDRAFSSCASLTQISVDENNPYYISIDGNLYTKDGKTMMQYATGKQDASFSILDGVTKIADSAFDCAKNLTTITIPESVISIGEFAFSNCTNLGSITIPDSVTSIGEFAFSDCTSLTSVTIPDSVTSIGDGAFHHCTSLSSVTIPDSVTTIDGAAFWGCTSLSGVTIPDSVTFIGNGAFYCCTSLTTINYRGTEEDWNAINKEDYWDYYIGNYTIVYNYTGE